MQPAGGRVPNTNDNALWHADGFAPGEHVLRIVTRGDADPRSGGKAITIESAVVSRAQ